jgi:hypothetical protein
VSLLNAVPAGSLSAYKRVPGQAKDFYISKDDGTVLPLSKFTDVLETPFHRYSFVIFGNSTTVEVAKLKDEPKP